jgi:RNA polymerase sigma factor (sigma-70 family)
MKLRSKLVLRNAAMLDARERLGWSQGETARAAGCSMVAVSAFERLDFRHVGRRVAEKIARVLALPIEAVRPPWAETLRQVPTLTATADVDPAALLAIAERHAGRMVLPSPEDLAVLGELQTRLREALMTLPERARLCVLLRDFHGLSEIEVGRALEIAPSTVGNHRAFALRTLRERLTGQGWTHETVDSGPAGVP